MNFAILTGSWFMKLDVATVSATNSVLVEVC